MNAYKKSFFLKAIAYLATACFFIYWGGMFLLALSSNHIQQVIKGRFPPFKILSGYSWRLFAPAYTYNSRLYFIIRDSHSHDQPDTIEVLEGIGLQKQQQAPFNQRENITDHLVNNNLLELVSIVWINKEKPAANMPPQETSAYIKSAIAGAESNTNYQRCLATLYNYCRLILKQQGIKATGKEIKIVIREKMIPSLKELAGSAYMPKERFVFETPFKPFDE